MPVDPQKVEQLQQEFKEQGSGTNARLRNVLMETAKLTNLMLGEALAFFNETPDFMLGGPQVREAFQADVIRLVKRLAMYATEVMGPVFELVELDERDGKGEFVWCGPGENVCQDPDALAPKTLEGLVFQRSNDHPDGLGAGTTPDAFLAVSLREQLNVLRGHVDEINEKFIDDILLGIPSFVKELVDDLSDLDVPGSAARALGKVALGAVVVVAIGGLGFAAYRLVQSRRRRA